MPPRRSFNYRTAQWLLLLIPAALWLLAVTYGKLWLLEEPAAPKLVNHRPLEPGLDALPEKGGDVVKATEEKTRSAATKAHCQHSQKEAWGTLFSGGASVNEDAIQTYVVAILTLVDSVRQHEKCPGRPFLVFHDSNRTEQELPGLQLLQKHGLTLMPLLSVKPPYKCRKRPELDVGWLKLRLWTLTEFRRIVMLDADMVAVGPLEALFASDVESPPTFLVSPMEDCTPKRCFNIGVMSIGPSTRVYELMMRDLHIFDNRKAKPDEQDQGWMDMYFRTRGLACGVHPGQLSSSAASDSEPNDEAHLLTWGLLAPHFNVYVNQAEINLKWVEATCAAAKPRLLHWPGRVKPWCVPSQHRTIFEVLWWKAAGKTFKKLGMDNFGSKAQCASLGKALLRNHEVRQALRSFRCCSRLGVKC